MYPHRIRLRGPWEAQPLDPPGPSRRVTLPARFGECGFGDCRRVLFRRRFGRPRQIDSHERVWLIGEGLSGFATFNVNGHTLGTHFGDAGLFEFAITELLADRNELEIELIAAGPTAGLWGDVALDVRCAAYLAEVQVAIDEMTRLRISGRVAGEADGPLDIYVLANGRNVGYTTCLAGAAFEIVASDVDVNATEVRIELVNGAVVWYVAEVAVR